MRRVRKSYRVDVSHEGVHWYEVSRALTLPKAKEVAVSFARDWPHFRVMEISTRVVFDRKALEKRRARQTEKKRKSR